MARQTVVQLIDDLDGSEAQGTVAFGLDGTNYEIDLSDQHASALRDAFAPYVAHGQKVGRLLARGHRAVTPRGVAPARADRQQAAAIREWARASGYTVSDRGRISAEITQAFQAAGGKPVPPAEPEPAPRAKAKPRTRRGSSAPKADAKPRTRRGSSAPKG
jgi:Lsr2